MAIEDLVVTTISDLVALAVNVIVRLFGFTEENAQKMVNLIGYVLYFLLVVGLFYITFKYS